MTPLDFAGARDDGSVSWHRAEPARALLEQSGWNRWLVLLPDGDEARADRAVERQMARTDGGWGAPQ